jgi:hypothetical protein
VFGGGYGGGSTAARVIVWQLQLVTSAATAVFGVLNNQALDNVYRGLRFIVNLAPCYLARNL